MLALQLKPASLWRNKVRYKWRRMQSKRKLFESIFFSYIGTLAAVLGPLLTLPVYFKGLGASQWGMMSVLLTLIALLMMVDGGLSQVLVREFALRARQHGHKSVPVRLLFAGCRTAYGFLAVTLAIALLMSSASIARHWLNLEANISYGDATSLLKMASLLVATQFFIALPRSLLLALDQHRSLNTSIAIAHTFRYGIGAVVVVLWQSLQYLLLWYAVVAIAEGAVRYGIAWRAVGMQGSSRERVTWSELKPLTCAGLKMSVAVVMSGLTTQLDKLILMKMVPLDQLGLYAIASSVATGLLSVGYPVIQAIFPTLLALNEDKQRMRKIFSGWLAALAVSGMLGMALYVYLGYSLLELWLQNREAAGVVYPVLLILLLGTMLNMMYQVGYTGWMLDANYRLPLIVNSLSVATTLLMTPLLIKEYGVTGAAAGWLAINIIGLLTSLNWFRKII